MDTTTAAARLLLATGLEVRVADLSQLGDDLLARIEGSDAVMRESLRREAVRFFGVCFQIVRLLSLDDIEGEFRVSAAEVDRNGEWLLRVAV